MMKISVSHLSLRAALRQLLFAIVLIGATVAVCAPWRREYVPFFRPFEFTVSFYGLKYFGQSNSWLDEQILLYGAYEKPLLYFMRSYIESTPSSERIFADVGANTGQHSLFMSRYVKAVHAFEPSPPVIARFRNNIDNNGIKNISLHPIGLGNKEAILPFYVDTSGTTAEDATGSFSEDSHKTSRQVDSLVIKAGDEVLAQAGVSNLSLLKIDIEGYEKYALAGLTQTLRRDRPLVVMELNIDKQHGFQNAEELRAAFPDNYVFYVFDKSQWNDMTGAYRLAAYDMSVKGQENLVVFPEERRELIRTSFEGDSF